MAGGGDASSNDVDDGGNNDGFNDDEGRDDGRDNYFVENCSDIFEQKWMLLQEQLQ